MGAPLVIIGLVVIVAIVVWLLVSTGVFAKSAKEGEIEPSGEAASRPRLRYVVPTGQDPAAVLAALARRGLETEELDSRTIAIRCDRDVSREDVRAAIAAAGTAVDDGASVARPVRFEDEP